MEYVLGFSLLFVTAVWLWRERVHNSARKRIATGLQAVAAGKRLQTDFESNPAERHRLEQIGREIEHLRQQRILAEANLQIILSSMQESVLVVDSRHSVRLANPSATKLFQFQPGVVGRPILEAIREPVLDDWIAAALQSGQPVDRELEVGARKPPLVVAVHIAPMRDAAGEAGALVMFRDVTRLTQLERVRREFVANVSHELRTPLAIFQGYVESLIDFPDMPRDTQAETFAILQKHSKRLNALVEDLLILARLEARNDELERTPLNIVEFLRETARDWQLRMEKKEVALKTDLPPSLPLLPADRMRLEQVMNNLLENALKYTPPGGTITISAARDVESVVISVRDTGAGILSTDLPHIFERFYRADKARTREVGGTGLGLSIVKHIVQAHGGRVGAESNYGKGTKVWLSIPLA